MSRLIRLDYLDVRLDLVETPTDPTPERATGVMTADGYLEVDALTFRDGLLRYSDGQDSWLELRPRDQVEAALSTFRHVPVTDDHPEEMVDAESWPKVARGHSLGSPSLVVVDGVTYVRDRIRIADKGMIESVRGDGPRQISIGFTSEVKPSSGVHDGKRYDAIQTAIEGNHYAVVLRGRAGPACRILDSSARFDGAAVSGYNITHDIAVNGYDIEQSIEDVPMPKPTEKPRADNVGSPVELVPVVGPDGQEVQLPTWVAAMLQELDQMKMAQAQAQPAPPAPAPPAPPAPAADMPGEPMPEDEENKDADEEEKAQDSIRALRRRNRVERWAVRAKLDDSKIDALEDTDTLARTIVETVAPWAKDKAAKARGDALDLLAETVLSAPVPEPTDVAPWGARPSAQPRSDFENDPVARALIEEDAE